MTVPVTTFTPAPDAPGGGVDSEAGLGALQHRARQPAAGRASTRRCAITGLVGAHRAHPGFRNPHDVPLEATYIFPLPDRAAVTAMRMTADGPGRRGRAQGARRRRGPSTTRRSPRASGPRSPRRSGRTCSPCGSATSCRASGSRVALTLVGPLSYEDGEATFRFPLVVAPRYIPGAPLAGPAVGDGLRRRTPTRCRTPRGSRRRCCCPASPTRCGCASTSTSTRPACRWARSGRSLHAVVAGGRPPAASSPASGSTATSSCGWPTASRTRRTPRADA